MEITTVGIDSANSISPPAGPTLGAGTIGRRRRLGRRLIASRRAHPALDPSSSADLVDHIDIGGDRRVRLHRRVGRIGKRIGGSLNLRTEADPATDTLRQQGLCDVGIVAEDLRRSDPVAEREQSACVQTQIAATVSRGSTDAHAKSGGCTPNAGTAEATLNAGGGQSGRDHRGRLASGMKGHRVGNDVVAPASVPVPITVSIAGHDLRVRRKRRRQYQNEGCGNHPWLTHHQAPHRTATTCIGLFSKARSINRYNLNCATYCVGVSNSHRRD